MVKFTAKIQNEKDHHNISLITGMHEQSVAIQSGRDGFGSSMNGGEALLLALATCYCNDIYREARNLNITVRQITVEVDADYDGQAGHPIENISYNVHVSADASSEAIENLIRHTDTVAEIHNTLRQGTAVYLNQITVASNLD